MNVYSIDVKIYGTAYIKAATEEDARKLAEELTNSVLEVEPAGCCDVEISGAQLDDPDLPEVSLSPAMTIHGPDEDAELSLEEENVPVEGEGWQEG